MERFPGLKQFMIDCKNMAIDLGYVTTVWGRKRRLPDLSLEPYEFRCTDGGGKDSFDPLEDDDEDYVYEVKPETRKYYTNLLNKSWGEKKYAIIAEAKKEGVEIVDNTMKIADAERQCVNSRIQGSAADMSKRAMILISKNQRLKELGFRMLIPVHDEIIGEAPAEHAIEAGLLLSELMIEAGKDLIVPIKCDAVLFKAWYDTEYKIEDERSIAIAKLFVEEVLKEVA